MKRILIVLVSFLFAAGVVYLGYIVFEAKSIVSVELYGNVQSLYFVGDEIDYGDAQLKVTYKNGTIKMVSLDSSSVDITMFSTSLEKHGTMFVNYKGFTLDTEYNVIQKGYYYVSETQTEYYNSSSTSTTYSEISTKMILCFDSNGVLKYYKKSGSAFYLYDGNYDDDYYYEINGDKIEVIAGDEAFEISVSYDTDGHFDITSIEAKTSGGYSIGSVTTTFSYYSMKTNRTIESVTVTSSNVSFTVGENIETSGQDIFAKVTYSYDGTGFLQTFYVRLTDAMVSADSLSTSIATSGTYAILYYEGVQFTLQYKVTY